jgi:hypothetical protein
LGPHQSVSDPSIGHRSDSSLGPQVGRCVELVRVESQEPGTAAVPAAQPGGVRAARAERTTPTALRASFGAVRSPLPARPPARLSLAGTAAVSRARYARPPADPGHGHEPRDLRLVGGPFRMGCRTTTQPWRGSQRTLSQVGERLLSRVTVRGQARRRGVPAGPGRQPWHGLGRHRCP